VDLLLSLSEDNIMGKWIHKGGKSRPDKRFKNILTPKKGAAKNKRKKK
jgi:hypothetical protein